MATKYEPPRARHPAQADRAQACEQPAFGIPVPLRVRLDQLGILLSQIERLKIVWLFNNLPAAHKELEVFRRDEASLISSLLGVIERLHIAMTPNDPSSATRPTGRNDCNRDAMAGFAAAHG